MEQETTSSQLCVIMRGDGCHEGIPAWGPYPRSHSQEVLEVLTQDAVRAQSKGPGTAWAGVGEVSGSDLGVEI